MEGSGYLDTQNTLITTIHLLQTLSNYSLTVTAALVSNKLSK
jgi:hypothetical protein